MNIVFADVDGTFQDFGQTIPTINIDAVRALHQQGDHFVFVTGRGYELAQELLETTQLPCDMIYGNGAGLKMANQAPQLRNCLAHVSCQKIIAALEEEDMFYFVHTDKTILVNSVERYQAHFMDLHQKFADELGEKGIGIMKMKEAFFTHDCQNVTDVATYLRNHPDLQVVKVEIMIADDGEKERMRTKLSSSEVFVFESYQQTLEVVNPLATKGTAIQNYLARFPQAKSYGIGDGENDLPMFEVVDVSVAMANASDTVKAACQEQAGLCKDGGLGTYIFQHIIQ
ncbi:HAD-IIB family hydrolase [Enterococcus saccharolyticus]|uniref:Hydrolase n=1 Tax=Candidatus Enterococcus willemsii TaxID=1857215 RepID=A0ABQ6YXJ6_9ENTE|nr:MULTISPECIES: HAD-IIB family hydrolase [Enterococcus]KAF1302415.1 hydrolase [Enterococcus sp. CU12B]MCD5002597.1 HAD-IIB family hydrolase [Enterococcus saccharolyticus]